MLQRGTTTKITILCLAGIFGVAWLAGGGAKDDRVKIGPDGEKKDVSRRNSVVLQDRPNNCGAASLMMISEHFGCPMSLRDLERKLVLSPGGTSLERLKIVADEFGLQAYGWRLRQEDLGRVRYPIIMFLKRNHFVVADSLDASGFLCVRDPAIGAIKMSPQTLPDIWGGEALEFSHNHTVSKEQMKHRENE
ncbi:MAG TPA: hypothetical protein DEP53_02085 [Bacteroidetes bacterium]|nr:hypothetical protein [Bacteroidota bacterium]